VRIAAYNPQKRELVLRRDGYVRRCDTGEVGMLLARSQRDAGTGPAPLRSVFSRDDAWVATGDLFRVDADGDYWRVDNAADVVTTKDGPAFTVPIRDALAGIAAVDLAVAYNVRPEGASADIAVAAVTLRGERDLDAREIGRALDPLPPHGRPSIVQVLDEIPVTTWYRPIVAKLRAKGIPEPDPDRQVWVIDEARERYRPLSATARKRLLRSVS
jgi:putative long chain acyl-CoA synthase